MNLRGKVKVKHWRGVQTEKAAKGTPNGDPRSCDLSFALDFVIPAPAGMTVPIDVPSCA